MSHKYLVVEFDNGEKWQVPAAIIAKHRAQYFADQAEETPGQVFDEEYAASMEDHYNLIQWAFGNMDWKDVKEHAQRIEEKTIEDYEQMWGSAKGKIITPED